VSGHIGHHSSGLGNANLSRWAKRNYGVSDVQMRYYITIFVAKRVAYDGELLAGVAR
jgi:hypothetical protein